MTGRNMPGPNGPGRNGPGRNGPGRNIVMIGMMGAGKTTVGRLVATALGRPFVDTDQMIESEQEQPVGQIFAKQGESRFRSLEAHVVRTVADPPGQVIAVGGGAVLDPGNVAALRRSGDLVWLDAPLSALLANVGTTAELQRRPLLHGSAQPVEELRRRRDERLDAYHNAADHVVDTEGKTPQVLTKEILEWAAQRPGLLGAKERP